jgi:catechol 2,3-dioxygenase
MVFLSATGAAPAHVALTEQAGASRQPRGTTGLYHFAILVPNRRELARMIRRLVDQDWPIGGASDHGVSEALYLDDPDGNGIEIYADRPHARWTYREGVLQMVTQPMDVAGVMAELVGDATEWAGIHPQTYIGHIHLHVSDLERARWFYHEVLGFDIVTYYGTQALFVSAGGYHHHIGLNTWAGVGAPPPPPGSVGLRRFTIRVPDAAEVGRLVRRLQQTDVHVEEVPGSGGPRAVHFRDPDTIGIEVQAGG